MLIRSDISTQTEHPPSQKATAGAVSTIERGPPPGLFFFGLGLSLGGRGLGFGALGLGGGLGLEQRSGLLGGALGGVGGLLRGAFGLGDQLAALGQELG